MLSLALAGVCYVAEYFVDDRRLGLFAVALMNVGLVTFVLRQPWSES